MIDPRDSDFVQTNASVQRTLQRSNLMNYVPKQTVVVPIDFSEASAMAVRTAIEMADTPDSVRVVHVLYKIDDLGPGALWKEQHEKFELEHATKHMANFLRQNEFEGVRQDILLGDPGSMIVKYSGDCDADLIVIPSHGYSGFKRLLLGSVAERVLRHAECPVYVLRRDSAQEPKQQETAE